VNPRPPLPPFTEETARQKVQAAEDAWNSRDPERVSSRTRRDLPPALSPAPASRKAGRTPQRGDRQVQPGVEERLRWRAACVAITRCGTW